MRSFVYFARNTVTDAVKIGTSTMPRYRATALASLCRAPVELVALAPGGRNEEAVLHAEVWGLHIGREWFRADRKLDRLAKAVAAGTFRYPADILSFVSPLRREASIKARATRHARLAAAALAEAA